MARPNRDRVMVTAYISRNSRGQLDRLAEQYDVNRSEVLRLALEYGLKRAEAALRKRRQSPR